MVQLPPFRRGRPVGFTDQSGRVYFDPDFMRDFWEPLIRSSDAGDQINGGVGYVYTIAPRAVTADPSLMAGVAQRVARNIAAQTAQRQSGAHTAMTAQRQPNIHKATTARRAASCAGYSIARRA